jgi:hypothetical protein
LCQAERNLGLWDYGVEHDAALVYCFAVVESVFVSYKFRDSDRQVALDIKRLVKSHLLTSRDGENLGGQPLWPAVSEIVQGTDATVALFLLPEDPTGQAWIRTEHDHACDNGRPVIAVVEDGFPWADPRNKEYVKFNRAAPLEGFLKLSETLGEWRRAAGRRVTVRLLPEMVARLAARQGYSCRYRLTKDFQAITSWIVVTPGAAASGIGFPASGIHDNVNIEIEINDGNRALYFSAADPSSVPAELRAFE